MKLGTRRNGTLDGELVVVSRDRKRAVAVSQVAPTLQFALDNWSGIQSDLARVSDALNKGPVPGEFKCREEDFHSPLPRAYQWCDGSTYLSHMELMVQIRKGSIPEWATTDPQLYQGGSDSFQGPTDEINIVDESWGFDFEAEIAIITDRVPMGTKQEKAGDYIRFVLLCNDVSLRNLTRQEREKGFGFYQSKPASTFSPIAVTPDDLGDAWDGDTIHLPLVTTFNGREFGRPDAGKDRQFGFRFLIAHAAKTRDLAAGTIIGSGTVSNRDRSVGSSCIAERRMIETLEKGKPLTEFMKAGDHVRIEMFDRDGESIFGCIEQKAV